MSVETGVVRLGGGRGGGKPGADASWCGDCNAYAMMECTLSWRNRHSVKYHEDVAIRGGSDQFAGLYGSACPIVALSAECHLHRAVISANGDSTKGYITD